MKSFSIETGSELPLAAAVVDASLRVARLVRAEARRRRPAGLSVSQLRALGFLRWNADASLAEVADHLDLGAPSTSKLVEDLVRRGLVSRAAARADRRRVELRLTASGESSLDATLRSTHGRIAELLAGIPEDDRAAVRRAAEVLRGAMAAEAAHARG